MSKTVLFQTNQFDISTLVQCQKQLYFNQFSLESVHRFNVKNSSFQTIQFSMSRKFSSIWPIDRTPSDSTTLDQSRPESDFNEGILCIPQSSCITEASLSDCLVSYLGPSLLGPLTLCTDAASVFGSLIRTRIDLGAMAVKGHTAIPKSPILLKPHHLFV